MESAFDRLRTQTMKAPRVKSLLQHPIEILRCDRLRPLRYLPLSVLAIFLAALPVQAARKIRFIYPPLTDSLPVSSLEAFAKTGTVDSDLGFYFRLMKADAKKQQLLREALTKPLNLDPILISRFFYSELGEDILTRLGRGIQIPNQGNGMHALRAAFILSALDSEGLSLLNFIKKYPTDLNIDVELALETARAVERLGNATTFFTQKMAQFAAKEAAGKVVDYSTMPDLRQPGPHKIQQQRWVLNDQSRDRQLYVIVVQPQPLPPGKIPVLIFSHGLGSRPEDFVKPAQQLASYGFLVALPQHPGSDTEQVQKLKQGLSSHFFLTSEFVNRPKDNSFVIDELQQRNQTEFGGRLDLQSVGVAGHSFGGYDALAVAGATIDFQHLQKECDRSLGHLNTSLLLQCNALNLPRQAYTFRDSRVKAVFAANPVNFAIFGPKGLGAITVPVFMVGGSDDPATPVVFEQAQSFPLLNAPIKYLALAEGQAHVNLANLDAGVTQTLNSIQGLSLASPFLLQSYANAMLLAFFETHLVENSTYQPYMQPAYAEYLSQNEQFKLFVISAASTNDLNEAIAEFKSKH